MIAVLHGSSMKTNATAIMEFIIPELHDDKLITWTWHLVNDLGPYDAIIGCSLMQFLGIDILFSDQTVKWKTEIIMFKHADCTPIETYLVQDHEQIVTASDRLTLIPAAKYRIANLQQISTTNTSSATAHLLAHKPFQCQRAIQKHSKRKSNASANWASSRKSTASNGQLRPLQYQRNLDQHDSYRTSETSTRGSGHDLIQHPDSEAHH